MFTGIVEEVGRVLTFTAAEAGARLEIECSRVLQDAEPGASIAVNGACLTAVLLQDKQFGADLSPETLARTNLGLLRTGTPVNLERPLRFNGRLDGHFVLGHVDGTGQITALEQLGNENWKLQVEVPEQLVRYLVSKASVAIDGISLTVAAMEGTIASFAIIRHTFENTNLKAGAVGSVVNVEVDILAKHIEKLLASR